MIDDPVNNDERLGLPSASDSLRYKCLGSRNLIQACKKAGLISGDDGGAAAESGTDIHRARAGEEVELNDSQEDMKQTLQRIEFNTVEALYPGLMLYSRERRMWLRRGLKPIFSGKYDAAYADSRLECVAIFDDKSGRLEVDAAERNYQMRDLAALWHFEHLGTQQLDVIISQPLITHEPSIARYHFAELEEAHALLLENLTQIADPDAPRTPGHHCRHCAARAHCEEAKSYSISAPHVLVAAIERGDVVLPLGEKGRSVLESIDVGYKILDKLWDAYEAAVVADPAAIPGWIMQEGSQRREITDYKKARALLINEGGIPVEEIDATSTFKLTEIEKAFCNRAGMIQAKAKRKFNDLLESVLKRKQDKASLKPIPQRGKRAKKATEELAL
jgi:hypothetical protein